MKGISDMSTLIDISGKTFNRITVIKRAQGIKSSRPKWVCHCSCGREFLAEAYRIMVGKTKSCGCFQRECIANQNWKHGCRRGKGTPEYAVWLSA